jgi:hypothetical protein
LIKDEKEGTFDTSSAENAWNVKVLDLERKKFGWGYGKLEVLFLNDKKTFFVIDADAVITGPVIDMARNTEADFIVDKEVQPAMRFNEIYYNLDRINELDKDFVYPGYSFNSGQWFGTSSMIKREDFDKTLIWSEPPETKDKNIVVNNDQGHLNYILHSFEHQGLVNVAKTHLMVWPVEGKDHFIQLDNIKAKAADYPFVIHWAGMSALKLSQLPRQDILNFYSSFYYSKMGNVQKMLDRVRDRFVAITRKVAHKLKK